MDPQRRLREAVHGDAGQAAAFRPVVPGQHSGSGDGSSQSAQMAPSAASDLAGPADEGVVEEACSERRSLKESIRTDFGEILYKLITFLAIFIGIAADLAFLIGWLYLIKGAHIVFDHIGKLSETGELLETAVETMFDTATLTIVGTYVARDVIRSIKREWGRK